LNFCCFRLPQNFPGRLSPLGYPASSSTGNATAKKKRQQGADTQINYNTLEDLIAARSATRAPLICRVNHLPGVTHLEIEQAIAAGADEILVPMLHTPAELEAVFAQVNGRCQVGILVETMEAVKNAPALAQFPLRRVYVGLNDLSIERGQPNIFNAVADGTVAEVRAQFRCPFGFAGLTLPERGQPIPCRLLMGELARLECSFSFLRRSFYRDIQGRELSVEILRMREHLQSLNQRTPQQVEEDHQALLHAISTMDSLPANSWGAGK
jgi:hypothetical protein